MKLPKVNINGIVVSGEFALDFDRRMSKLKDVNQSLLLWGNYKVFSKGESVPIGDFVTLGMNIPLAEACNKLSEAEYKPEGKKRGRPKK